MYTLNIDNSYLYIFIILGIISFFIAEISAYSSNNMQRIFAYSTLGQLGIIFLAFSYQNNIILSGAIILIFFHSLTKLMLFLAFSIKNKKGNNLFLNIIFIIGFLSLLGIPPFGGFIAKLTILTGLASMQEYLIVSAILIISLIEATYLFRIIANLKDSTQTDVAIPFLQKIVLVFIAFIIIYFGISPDTIIELSQDIAKSMMELKNV